MINPGVNRRLTFVTIIVAENQLNRNINIVDALLFRQITAKNKNFTHTIHKIIVSVDSANPFQKFT